METASFQELQKAGADLNITLGLSPKIPMNVKKEELVDQIMEAKEVVENTDDLKDTTWTVLRSLEPEPIVEKLHDVLVCFGESYDKNNEICKKCVKLQDCIVEMKAKKQDGKKQKSKPGIINTIIECLGAPISKEDILVVLTEKFSDRDPKSMKNTINAQLGFHLKNRKNVKSVIKTEDKLYTIVMKED